MVQTTDTPLPPKSRQRCFSPSITGTVEPPAALVLLPIPKRTQAKSNRTKRQSGLCPYREGNLPIGCIPASRSLAKDTGGRECDPGFIAGSDVPSHGMAVGRCRVPELQRSRRTAGPSGGSKEQLRLSGSGECDRAGIWTLLFTTSLKCLISAANDTKGYRSAIFKGLEPSMINRNRAQGGGKRPLRGCKGRGVDPRWVVSLWDQCIPNLPI